MLLNVTDLLATDEQLDLAAGHLGIKIEAFSAQCTLPVILL